MGLNVGQTRSKSEILGTINSTNLTDDKYHTFRGGAGFGKTYTIVDLIKDIPVHKSIGLTAPTHKAVKVLRNMCQREKIEGRVDIRTIHSALGLKLVKKGGEEVITRDTHTPERTYDVLMIDEGSMLGDDITSYIIDSESGCVIFIGDEYQISPVDAEPGEISPVFTQVERQSELDEVVRCSVDNPIIKLATKFRKCQDDVREHFEYNFPTILHDVDSDGNGVHVLHMSEFVQSMVSRFASKEFIADVDYCRCITYTNKQAIEVNLGVRRGLHGADVPDYISGEVIVAQEGTEDFQNSEEFRILTASEDVCFDDTPDGIPYWNLCIKSLEDGRTHNVKVVKSDGMKYYKKILDTWANRAYADSANAKLNWAKYWRIKGAFIDFKHIYACTAHKSQGSTIEHTYIWTPDFIRFGPTLEILQLLYTGTTRSSQSSYFAR